MFLHFLETILRQITSVQWKVRWPRAALEGRKFEGTYNRLENFRSRKGLYYTCWFPPYLKPIIWKAELKWWLYSPK